MGNIDVLITFLAFVVLLDDVCFCRDQEFQPVASKPCKNVTNLLTLVNCKTEEVIKALEVASTIHNIKIYPGALLMSRKTSRSNRELNLVEELPVDPTERFYKVVSLLYEACLKFIKGRTLIVKFPDDVNGVSRMLVEGRGKMKKVMDPLMFGLRAKLMGMIPVVMGGFGFLSTKALFIANVAFVLALISVFQLFFAGRTSSSSNLNTAYGYGTYGSYNPSYNVPTWNTNQLGGQIPYARSIDVSSPSPYSFESSNNF